MRTLAMLAADNVWDIAKSFSSNGETAVKGLAGLGAMWFIVGGVWKATAKLAALILHVVIAGVFMFALNQTNWLGTVAGNTIKPSTTASQQGMGAVTQTYDPFPT